MNASHELFHVQKTIKKMKNTGERHTSKNHKKGIDRIGKPNQKDETERKKKDQ